MATAYSCLASADKTVQPWIAGQTNSNTFFMNFNTDSLEERVRHLELLTLFMQVEISTLSNLLKRTVTRDEVEAEMLRQFANTHQEQFRSLFANLPDRAAFIRQMVADYSGRVQLEMDHSVNAP